jgi:hypothetical protein
MKFNLFVVAFLALVAVSMAAPPKTSKLSYKQAMKVKAIGCDICTLVMTEIDHIIAADATEDAILEAILPICEYLGATLVGFCTSLIESNLHAIIDGLVHNQLSPEAVCGTLSLC